MKKKKKPLSGIKREEEKEIENNEEKTRA